MVKNRKQCLIVSFTFIICLVTSFTKRDFFEQITNASISQIPQTEDELKKWPDPFTHKDNFDKDKAFIKEENYSVNSGFILNDQPKGELPDS